MARPRGLQVAGDALARCRAERGLTRVDLANVVKVNPSTVANLENGHQPRASLTLLEQLARAVRTDVNSLIRGGE